MWSARIAEALNCELGLQQSVASSWGSPLYAACVVVHRKKSMYHMYTYKYNRMRGRCSVFTARSLWANLSPDSGLRSG